MTPISSKIHSTFGVKITLKRELKYRSKKYSQIGVNWDLFFLLHFWSQIYSLKITVMCLFDLVWTFDLLADVIEFRRGFLINVKKSVGKQIEIIKKQ